MKKENLLDLIKIVLLFGIPFAIIILIALWLNPSTFWQKLIMLVSGIFGYLLLLKLEIEIIER